MTHAAPRHSAFGIQHSVVLHAGSLALSPSLPLAPSLFDDFLGLADRDFSRHELVIFYGRSGSGKSTAIEFLRCRDNSWTVLDEITTPSDFCHLAKRICQTPRLLIATHVHPIFIRMLRPFARTAVFQTDRDPSKLHRYLENRSVTASPRAIELYVKMFGATYTDAEVILERHPSPSFDHSLARFRKFDRLR